ncbi:MAG: hypothetical protein E7639_04855 [Ruminococcaceae bacterium]|nr:hypothetical protein [Oscillospiraceae bacterium]
MSKYNSCTYGELTALANEAKGLFGVTATSLGYSILREEIPVFTLGEGKRCVVLVGGLQGTEAISAALLLDFIKDYSQQVQKGNKVYEINMPYLFAERRIIVVPFLNPDGIAYATEGIHDENPLFERVCRMNGGRELFDWQANARGVTLTRNFQTGFAEAKAEEAALAVLNGAPFGFGGEYPESEPESAALGRLLRFLGQDLLGMIEWRVGSGVSCSCRDKLSAKTLAAGRILSRVLGSREQTPVISPALGAPSDWCIEALSRPAYRVGLDRSLLAKARSRASLYERVRQALFTFPFML